MCHTAGTAYLRSIRVAPAVTEDIFLLGKLFLTQVSTAEQLQAS